jgi:hypothetical protein
MYRSRKLLIFAIVASLAAVGTGAQASKSQSPNLVMPAAPDPALAFEIIERVATANKVSSEVARDSLEDSGPLMDFQVRYQGHPDFGALSISYQPKYQINIRLAQSGDSSELRAAVGDLDFQTIGEIALSTGGPSYAAMENWKRELSRFDRARFATLTDSLEGTVTVRTADEMMLKALSGRNAPSWIKLQKETPKPAKLKNFPGADRWMNTPGSGWDIQCTWAGTIRNDSTSETAQVTAGHCDNHVSWANGYTVSTAINEECSSWRDTQLHFFQNANPAVYSQFPSGNYAPWWFSHEVAGGAYQNQQVVAVGATSRAEAPNQAIVSSFRSFDWSPLPDVGGGMDCVEPSPWQLYGPIINDEVLAGDSGGPMMALYFNGSSWDYYLLGIISNGDTLPTGEYTQGTFAAWATPPGWRWCVATSPC